jgi:hypothetical protein
MPYLSANENDDAPNAWETQDFELHLLLHATTTTTVHWSDSETNRAREDDWPDNMQVFVER